MLILTLFLLSCLGFLLCCVAATGADMRLLAAPVNDFGGNSSGNKNITIKNAR
jgi:hypothetical protein